MIKDYYIRFVTIDDLSEMKLILKNATRDWGVSILESCFKENYKNWGVFLNDEMLGFVIIRNLHSAWEVMQVVIDQQYQRQKLGERLLQFVITEAQKNNIEKIQLEVRRSNTAAIALYLKSGFHSVGVRKKYYSDGEDAVLMDRMV